MRTSTIPCSGFTTLVGLHRITTNFLGKVLCQIPKDTTELMALKTNLVLTVLDNFYGGSVRCVGYFAVKEVWQWCSGRSLFTELRYFHFGDFTD